MLTRMLSHNRTNCNIGQFHSLDGYQEDIFMPLNFEEVGGAYWFGSVSESIEVQSSVSMTVMQY